MPEPLPITVVPHGLSRNFPQSARWFRPDGVKRAIEERGRKHRTQNTPLAKHGQLSSDSRAEPLPATRDEWPRSVQAEDLSQSHEVTFSIHFQWKSRHFGNICPISLIFLKILCFEGITMVRPIAEFPAARAQLEPILSWNPV
jgi:hypothetical protein